MSNALSVLGVTVCAANTAASARSELPAGDTLRLTLNEVASSTGCYVKLGTRDVVAAVGTAPTAATQALTLTGQAATGQTVTIGSRVYTWRTSLTVPAVPNEVLRGANAAASVANLVLAINAGSGAGTNYSTGTTAHELVTAVDDTGDVVTITAKVPGAAGNAIATTDTSDNMSWASTTMANGADGVRTSMYIPVRGVVEVKKNGAVAIAAIGVGANALLTITGLG